MTLAASQEFCWNRSGGYISSSGIDQEEYFKGIEIISKSHETIIGKFTFSSKEYYFRHKQKPWKIQITTPLLKLANTGTCL